VDDFVGIAAEANERIDWLRRFLKRGSGIPSHDTFGRLFGLLDRCAVGKGFRRGVSSELPDLTEGTVIAIDGKASRRILAASSDF
jgi:hypothetical protein